MKFHYFLILSILFGTVNSVNAQSAHTIGNWDVLILKGKIAEKYFYNAEFNVRKSPAKAIYDYSEYKIILGKMLNQNWSFDFGTGIYNSNLTGTFLTTPPSRQEYRTWIDILLKNSLNRLYFDHRIRIEHRFNNSAGAPDRFRYKPSLTIPLNHTKVKENTFFLNTSNDIYFGTGATRLELIMFYTGGGYRINNRFTCNLGNMYNYDFRKTKDKGRSFLYLTFIFDLTSKKQVENKEAVNSVISVR